MKNLLLIFCTLFSVLVFSQEEEVKMHKASNVSKTIYGENEALDTKSLAPSTSKAAGGTVNGSISGNLSVSLSGGVNYSVPIDVPPGLNGVQPEIALAFDSHSGNGLAGWGWNISGVSVITRIPSTSFHDNQIDGVDFDMDDRFALDGQRLIVKTGNYGADGTVYQTEQYSNLKIISYGSHPDSGVQGPASFKVFYPDGAIGYYGNTTVSPNSRSKTDYAISYWENPQGIRISYSYTQSNNALYISTITYGHVGSGTPVNEIAFEYVDRNFNEMAYVGGNQFLRDKILNIILVKGSGNTLFRKYTISRSLSSLGYNRISGIREYTGDTTDSRSVSFQYNGNTYDSNAIHNLGLSQNIGVATELSLSSIEQRNAEVISLDYTGNGKMDFIVYPITGLNTKKKFWLFTDIQGSMNYSDAIDTGSFQAIFPVNWLNLANIMMPNQGLAVVQNTGSAQVAFKIWADAALSPSVIQYSKTWDAPTYKPVDYCLSNNSSYFRVPLEYISGDFNGDGLSDVIAIEKKYTATDCFEQPASSDPTCPDKVTRDGVQYCCYGCSTTTHNISKVHLIELDRRKTSNFAHSVGYLGRELKATDKLLTMDLNGDGKTDILQVTDGSAYAYALNKFGNLELLWETTNTAIDLDFPIIPGDYNGDGKGDFLIPTANNSDAFEMFLSTGKSFFKKSYLNQSFEYKADDYDGSAYYGYNLLPADINGDGKTDIVEYNTITYNGNSNGTQYIRLHQNAVKAYTSDYPTFIVTNPLQTTGNLTHFPIPIFLSSKQENGNLEFATISDKWVRSYTSLKDHREDVTLKQITNNGVVTNIKYDKVNTEYYDDSDPSFIKSYFGSYGQVFPYVNVNNSLSFKVVRQLDQSGSGISRTREFVYEGAVSHASGLGFAGFNIIKRSDWYGNDVAPLWTISKHDPLLRGAVIEQIVANTSDSNPFQYMSKVTFEYDYKLIANPGSPLAPQYTENITRNSLLSGAQTDVAEQTITLSAGFHAIGSNGDYWGYIFPPEEQPGDTGYAGAVDILLERMETDNGLTGVLTTETYTYDQYNNPLVTTTSYPGGSKVVTRQYYNNAGATNNTYHIGRIKNIKVNTTLNGSSFSTEEQYVYSNNLVTQIQRKGNGTGWLTESFGHDANGNITSRTLTDGGSITRSEAFEYSAAYGARFLTKSVDVEGLETTFVYEAHTGNLQSTTDPYGLSTNYLYDNWSRVTKETDYLTNDTNHTYTTLSGGGLQHATDYADGGQELTVYNAFGWVSRTGALSLNTQWSYTDYEYYIDGKIRRESEPHNGSASQWNTYYFDEYGRPTTQTLYTGRNIDYTYSGLSATVNDGVKSVTTTLDALGNTIKIQDPGGTVDYTYFANGTLKTADYGGNVVTVGIDGWGRKTSLNDPSAGSYGYTYNGVGELLTETTPMGTTTYTYDNNTGRLTGKTVIGDLTDLSLTYIYDPTFKQLTDIDGVDNTNSGRAYTYDYEYDPYRRPWRIKENTGLANFEYEMDYDPYGRVETETQISTLAGGASKTVVTKNVYDASGLLKEIWNDSGTPAKLWELNTINARGQALTITLGNGMVKNKTYDAYGYLTRIEDKESDTNPTVALHTEYDFHQQKGTLNNRENFGFNWQETFDYDNLDRLTTISGNVSHTMTYAGNGNISNNTSLGTYEYGDTSKKYRLTEIDPNTTGGTYFQQHPTQQISYNAFKKPIDIHEAGHGRVSFEYGPMMSRSTAYYGGEQADKSQRRYRKHYSSIIPVEIVEDTQAGTTKIITYVGGDAYTAPIAHIKRTGTGAIDEYHYLHRDYLGSILAITDAGGDVKEERQFGAWGTVDKFLDSASGTIFSHASLLGRGYTGHEHFFEVGLIHMNGRMYDAQLGRFLSPDNHIQDPFNTQSYNRYGYVWNNPLMYTDTTGEIAEWIIVGAIILLSGVQVAIKNGWFDGGSAYAPTSYANAAPTPGNLGNSSEIASSMSRQSRGAGGRSLEWATFGNDNFEYSTPVVSARYGSAEGPYGISLTGRADPLQGLTPPNGFRPNDGLSTNSFGITAEDVADTALDFVPIAGGVKDIYKGIRDGEGWQVALGTGSIILDIFTLGGSSLAKGAILTGIKGGGRFLARRGAMEGVQGIKSLGAAARNWKNVKIIGNNLLKKNGIDAHTFKRDFLGKNAKISEYDLYKHTDTGEILIFKKGGVGEPIFTGEYIK